MAKPAELQVEIALNSTCKAGSRYPTQSVMRALLPLLGLLVLTGFASAGTYYYVDATNGNDANTGTFASPWKTVAKVNDTTFLPGDVILFHRGQVWREELIPSSSGVPGAPIVFGPYASGPRPILDAQFGRTHALLIKDKSYIRVGGLQLENTYFNGSNGASPLAIIDSPDVTVHWMTLKNSDNGVFAYVGGNSPRVILDHMILVLDAGHSARRGIVVAGPAANDPRISYNVIPDLRRALFAILTFDVNNPQIFGNIVTGNGIGIAFNACRRSVSGAKIHDNYLRGITTAEGDGETIEITGDACKDLGISASADVYRNVIVGGPKTYGGIDGEAAINSRVWGNIVLGIQRSAFHWTYYSSNNVFANNTVASGAPEATAFAAISHSTGNQYKNNIVYKMTYGFGADRATAPFVSEDYNLFYDVGQVRVPWITAGEHDRLADPLFVDSSPVGPNGLKLQVGSPAIDSGLESTSPYDLLLDPTCDFDFALHANGPSFPYLAIGKNLSRGREQGAFGFRSSPRFGP